MIDFPEDGTGIYVAFPYPFHQCLGRLARQVQLVAAFRRADPDGQPSATGMPFVNIVAASEGQVFDAEIGDIRATLAAGLCRQQQDRAIAATDDAVFLAGLEKTAEDIVCYWHGAHCDRRVPAIVLRLLDGPFDRRAVEGAGQATLSRQQCPTCDPPTNGRRGMWEGASEKGPLAQTVLDVARHAITLSIRRIGCTMKVLRDEGVNHLFWRWPGQGPLSGGASPSLKITQIRGESAECILRDISLRQSFQDKGIFVRQ
ncbi:hypothetical protein ACCD05_08580 [Rhizobium sp. Rhizsp42]